MRRTTQGWRLARTTSRKKIEFSLLSGGLSLSRVSRTDEEHPANQELIADGVEELREYMSEVLPQKPSNYSEKEKLFDCTDINIPDVFESLIA